jgi:hypothetical protein
LSNWQENGRHKGKRRGLEIDDESLKTLAAAFPQDVDDRALKAALARSGGITTEELLRKAKLAAGEARQG